MENKLLHRVKKGSGGRQVVCFPYLGGHSGSFDELAATLPDDVEVCVFNPPGHGLSRDLPFEHALPLLGAYAEELAGAIKPGCVWFGHSLGGIAAYYMACKLVGEKRIEAGSFHLALSACNAPDELAEQSHGELPDDLLIDRLVSYDGIPAELAREKDLLAYFLPTVRADFKLLRSFVELESFKLPVSVSYFWGTRDRTVPLGSVLKWSAYLEQVRLFAIPQGSHMFIADPDGARIVAERLEERLPTPSVVG
ncbi:alpha/beta fold hydrolase [Saccharibacillus sp. CPCC 101409]|uniref:thioesterase II family protein n=1 Tax=Saccharibacillus sp. CPCC 101409 TaxID=3058041 RepID=UPI00267395FB|nr:alpha/beta fold hydrolase [Saccharibacillus sp. CPCC 101409]MDO3410490.1 alpha/beta fold hydrolase [Saccharibacillus sp. CPCC 101409]